MSLGKSVVIAALTVFSPAILIAQSAPSYKIIKTISLGPGERWDYATFDPPSGRVYVAHGDHVTVVDVAKGAIVGEIGTFPGGTHGIGISHESGLGFTDDGKAGTAEAFDLETLKVVKHISAAPDADGIVFDPASKHIFVVEGDSGSISVIDPKKDAVAATITVGAGLEAAVADGQGKLFVDGVDKHDIVAIDTMTNTVLAHWPMTKCERPHGLAMDTVTHRLFATCSNNVMIVLNAQTGENLASLPIGMGSDGAAFDPVHKRALSSNNDGTVTIIQEKDANNFVSLGNAPSARSARTMALDPKTGTLFLPAAEIAKTDPPATPDGRPRVSYVPGSLKLLVLEPQG